MSENKGGGTRVPSSNEPDDGFGVASPLNTPPVVAVPTGSQVSTRVLTVEPSLEQQVRKLIKAARAGPCIRILFHMGIRSRAGLLLSGGSRDDFIATARNSAYILFTVNDVVSPSVVDSYINELGGLFDYFRTEDRSFLFRNDFLPDKQGSPVVLPPSHYLLTPLAALDTTNGRAALAAARAPMTLPTTTTPNTPLPAPGHGSAGTSLPIIMDTDVHPVDMDSAPAITNPPSSSKTYARPGENKRQKLGPPAELLPAYDNTFPIKVARLFADVSPFFASAARAQISDSQLSTLINCALLRRLRTDRSQRSVARLVAEFVAYANELDLPFSGPDALVALHSWILSLHSRGPTVPHAGLYAVRAYSGALELGLPVNSDAVVAASRANRARAKKQAPPVPLELLLSWEEIARSSTAAPGKRLFASYLTFLCLSSARFKDTIGLDKLETNETAIYGAFRDLKNFKAQLRPFAAPLAGINGQLGWALPLLEFHATYKNRFQKIPSFLCPKITKEWGFKLEAAAYYDVYKHLHLLLAGAKFEKHGITPQSPRNFMPTCASQLGWSREDRETLGRWKPGSIMPNVYDRAACVTELRLRSSVSKQIQSGWIPANSFEIPMEPVPKPPNPDFPSSDSDSSSTGTVSDDEAIVDSFIKEGDAAALPKKQPVVVSQTQDTAAPPETESSKVTQPRDTDVPPKIESDKDTQPRGVYTLDDYV